MTLPQPARASVAEASPAFAEAYPGLFRTAYRVAYRLLGDREEAADAAQEALARACARWGRLVKRGDPAPWVVRVSANLAVDRWRRQQRAARHREMPATSPGPEPTRVDLHRALATLSRRQREVVLLRYVADLPEAAVAAALGCATGTVKTHAARGLAALRAFLGEAEE